MDEDLAGDDPADDASPCAICGMPLDGDPDEDARGDAGMPICGGAALEAGRTIIHTGYWGCGAFGGNRILMAMLQAIAAQLAGVDRLVFHTGLPGGGAPLLEGLRRLRDDFDGLHTTSAVIARIDEMAFQWGHSDGN